MPIYSHHRYTVETTSFPWDWVRSKTRIPALLDGYWWQFETNTVADNLLTHRVREAVGDENKIGRYCTPSKAYKSTRSPNGSGVWCPYDTELLAYFGANIHDTVLSPYLHTDSPYADANRYQQLTANDWWLRFAQSNVLDYMFGVPAGTGKRADGSDCWVLTRHLNVDPDLRVLCQDNVIKTSTETSIHEDNYNTLAKWWAAWAVYLEAFQSRIITPRSLKLIINTNFTYDTYEYAASVIQHTDGMLTEYLFCMYYGASSKRWAWNTGDYRLYEIIEILKHYVSNDKMVLLGQEWEMSPIYLTASSGTGYFKVYTAERDTEETLSDSWTIQWQTSVSYTLDDTYSGTNATKTNGRCEHNGTIAGTAVRLTIPCHASITHVFEKVTIGASTSNDDFDATPTKILFSGSESVTLTGGGGTVVSDSVAFTFAASTRHLVAVLKPTLYLARFKSAGLTGNDYYEKGTDSDESSTQTVTGYTLYPNVVQDVSKIEVARDIYQFTGALTGIPAAVTIDSVVGAEQVSYEDLWDGNDKDWWYDSGEDILYIRSTSDPDSRTVDVTYSGGGGFAVAIGLKHASIAGGAYTNYFLSDYSTIAALITAMETDYDSVFTFNTNITDIGCDELAQYDSPHILATQAETSFTTTGAYVRAMEPSRYAWLTCLAIGVLAGADIDNDIYLGLAPGGSSWSPGAERTSDLLNFPLEYADDSQSDYIQCPGTTGTDQYSRNIVDAFQNLSSIGILNWEATALTVQAADFNITSFIDPFVTRFDPNYTHIGAAKVTSVTIPAYAGTVLWVGDGTPPVPSPPEPEELQWYGLWFDPTWFI